MAHLGNETEHRRAAAGEEEHDVVAHVFVRVSSPRAWVLCGARGRFVI